jgi:hypothetical protein
VSRPTGFDFGTSDKDLARVAARWKRVRDPRPRFFGEDATHCYRAFCGCCAQPLGRLVQQSGHRRTSIPKSDGTGEMEVMSFGPGVPGPWVMQPERASPPSPPPVYYGDGERGYRIAAEPGKASARDRGRRIGRRPNRTGGIEAAPPKAQKLLGARIKGQVVVPPCPIWCLTCGHPNEVPLPPGFRQLADGAIEEERVP